MGALHLTAARRKQAGLQEVPSLSALQEQRVEVLQHQGPGENPKDGEISGHLLTATLLPQYLVTLRSPDTMRQAEPP
ncbi:hypothetical protein GDO78_019893 [Eleutherodactylus coqui]|uniref:Uncharacterized protein n=1 Tax=Eleutherodactylus coqui TaxID=57060 RepID=A0A8J6EI51_ELECQ|nr:hypothetical protein GDO78_019893 [Eleutherodactylus coqui]